MNPKMMIEVISALLKRQDSHKIIEKKLDTIYGATLAMHQELIALREDLRKKDQIPDVVIQKLTPIIERLESVVR